MPGPDGLLDEGGERKSTGIAGLKKGEGDFNSRHRPINRTQRPVETSYVLKP